MISGRRWAGKPPIGTRIDKKHPLSRNLICFVPMWSNSNVIDIVGGLHLILRPGTSFGTSTGGMGLVCNGNGQGAFIILPESLQVPLPLSIAVGFGPLGPASATSAPIAGLSLGPDGGNGGNSLQIGINSSAMTVATTSNTTGISTTFFPKPPTSGNHVISASGDPVISSMYLNGIGNVARWSSVPGGGFTYAANSILQIGCGGSFFFTRNSNMIFYWVAIWNRILTTTEHAIIGTNTNAIWQIFKPRFDPTLVRASQSQTTITYPGYRSLIGGNRGLIGGNSILL